MLTAGDGRDLAIFSKPLNEPHPNSPIHAKRHFASSATGRKSFKKGVCKATLSRKNTARGIL